MGRAIEIAMNLGVDPRHADQMVRGVVNLPKGTGKTVRVAVFARGAKADEAKAAGADIVGAEDLLEIVQGGTIEFAKGRADSPGPFEEHAVPGRPVAQRLPMPQEKTRRHGKRRGRVLALPARRHNDALRGE